MNPKFSLLQATFRAGQSAVDVRDAWFASARSGERIEHIFAYDEDDALSASVDAIARDGVKGLAMAPRVSAVRNWNAAAQRARGDLLLVVADDLLPPVGWDSILLDLVGALDPRIEAFVVKARDFQGDDSAVMRHPIVSRRYYERFGLWNPVYDGYGVDNEFTLDAHLRGRVLDGRSLVMLHKHPNDGFPPSESHVRMRSSGGLFEARIPEWKRFYRRSYVKPEVGAVRLPRRDIVRCAIVARLGYLWGVVPGEIKSAVRDARRGGR